MKYDRLIILIGICIKCTLSHAQSHKALKTDNLTHYLNVCLPNIIDSAAIHGISICNIQNSQILWSKHYGYKNISTKEPVDNQTLFEAASLSKPLFAYIVLQMYDQGKIDLDQPLWEYVEETKLIALFFKKKITDPRMKKITARMVLSHASGFPNWRPKNQALKIEFEPASDLQYSGEGFELLQRTVESLTGKNLQELAEEYVFKPLGMQHSAYIWKESFTKNMAQGYFANSKTTSPRKHKAPSAAYSLYTSLQDYSKFIMALLHGKNLKESTFLEMISVQSTARTGYLKGLSWGLGLGVYEYEKGKKALWHWGDFGNFKAYMVLLMDQEKALLMLSNSFYGMSIVENLVHELLPGKHPNIPILKYENYDAPSKWIYQYMISKSWDEGMQLYLRYRYHKDTRLNEQALYVPALKFLATHHYQKAEALLQLNLEAYPDFAPNYYKMGEIYLHYQKVQQAKDYYRKALALDPEYQEAQSALEKLN